LGGGNGAQVRDASGAEVTAKPLAIDLFCGLGGWSDGLIVEGWDVIGFDIERHVYGGDRYPAQTVLQDVLTLHGSQFHRAALIVASPPCQAYSYRAMPWKRAKALPPPSNELFDACFRLQREASASAGRHIPMVVENVKGAQPWVGRAAWHYGSYYLWGDVPALMLSPQPALKWGQCNGKRFDDRPKGNVAMHREGTKMLHREGTRVCQFCGYVFDETLGKYGCPNCEGEGIKQPGLSGEAWFDEGAASFSSKSASRKAASARIAKIPGPLARYIGQVFKPDESHLSSFFGESQEVKIE